MTTRSFVSSSSGAATLEQVYEHEETRALVSLVEGAAELVRTKGEAAFKELGVSRSQWRHEETYVFVLDAEGNMLVHADPSMEGQNQLDLKDINGKPIVRGLLDVATHPDKPEGWYHYEWPVPGGLLPRWKSSYVKLVEAPSGKRYVVGSGLYNDRMERAFVVDLVTNAVAEIDARGQDAFTSFRDPKGPFMAKDAYIFVLDMDGVELVNPAFPNLEGRALLDYKDTQGRPVIRELIEMVQIHGSGWVDYTWPKPGESLSTRKSAYVSKAKLGTKTIAVGCGVYLADAPKLAVPVTKMTAAELVALVREGAALVEKQGEQSFAEFRRKGSKWFRDDTYFFVWTIDGTRIFHAPDPSIEGMNVSAIKDILGRPVGKMILDAAASPVGEGWMHYMYPEPGSIFPSWKSTFVKRVTFPSGEKHILGCGIYNMQMERTFIEDMVNRAAALIAEQGKDAFNVLRDRTGPFVFMDTYVFVDGIDGTELVNPAQPSLEGKNLLDLKDLRGTPVVRDEIAAAKEHGSTWMDFYWYRPGDNKPARKQTFVRMVRSDKETYVVGSGIYVDQ
jgi:signal transduction histidine kinase